MNPGPEPHLTRSPGFRRGVAASAAGRQPASAPAAGRLACIASSESLAFESLQVNGILVTGARPQSRVHRIICVRVGRDGQGPVRRSQKMTGSRVSHGRLWAGAGGSRLHARRPRRTGAAPHTPSCAYGLRSGPPPAAGRTEPDRAGPGRARQPGRACQCRSGGLGLQTRALRPVPTLILRSHGAPNLGSGLLGSEQSGGGGPAAGGRRPVPGSGQPERPLLWGSRRARMPVLSGGERLARSRRRRRRNHG